MASVYDLTAETKSPFLKKSLPSFRAISAFSGEM